MIFPDTFTISLNGWLLSDEAEFPSHIRAALDARDQNQTNDYLDKTSDGGFVFNAVFDIILLIQTENWTINTASACFFEQVLPFKFESKNSWRSRNEYINTWSKANTNKAKIILKDQPNYPIEASKQMKVKDVQAFFISIRIKYDDEPDTITHVLPIIKQNTDKWIVYNITQKNMQSELISPTKTAFDVLESAIKKAKEVYRKEVSADIVHYYEDDEEDERNYYIRMTAERI